MERNIDNLICGEKRVFPRLTGGVFEFKNSWCMNNVGHSTFPIFPIDNDHVPLYLSIIWRCILLHKANGHDDDDDISTCLTLHEWLRGNRIIPCTVPFCVALKCSSVGVRECDNKPWQSPPNAEEDNTFIEEYNKFIQNYWTTSEGIPGCIQIGHVHILYGQKVEGFSGMYVDKDLDDEIMRVAIKQWDEVRTSNYFRTQITTTSSNALLNTVATNIINLIVTEGGDPRAGGNHGNDIDIFRSIDFADEESYDANVLRFDRK
jgi:hypothetical protein